MPQLDNAYSTSLTAAALFAGGEILGLANPFGEDVYIKDLVLDCETTATGACTCDAGIAASATTSSGNLIDGADIGSGAAALVVASPSGTNGKAAQRWGTTEYLTVTGSADSSGLVGEAKFRIVRI